jgi:hypothetical protein
MPLDPAKKNSIVLTEGPNRAAAYSLIGALFFLLVTASLSAQPPTAPIPAQITSGKTLFLANAGTMDNEHSTLAYSDLYRQLSVWPGHTLTSSPDGAGLALELSLNLIYGVPCYFSLRLDIRDMKTHALLWTLTEPVGTLQKNTLEKNLDPAVTKIAADLKRLAAETAKP